MKRRRGMAMVMALVCVGLLTTTLTVAGVMLAGESRRTNIAAEDAQLRQLLLAGAKISQSRLSASWTSDQILSIDLPQFLRDQGGTLTIQLVSPGTVDIEARLPKRRASQRVQFAQQNGDWHVIRAEFGE